MPLTVAVFNCTSAKAGRAKRSVAIAIAEVLKCLARAMVFPVSNPSQFSGARCPGVALPAAQSLDDLDGIRGKKRARHIEDLLPVDEEAHIRPQLVLLVDHAEAEARITPVEVGKQLGEVRADCLDLARHGVGAQRRRDEDLHASRAQPSSAVSTA